NAFGYELAVDRDGDKFFVPGSTAGPGAIVYNYTGGNFVIQGRIGISGGGHQPIGGVFSPVTDILFTAENAQNNQNYGVRVYDANTLAYLATIDAFNFQYNGLVDNGRMEISPDGR